MPGGEVELMGDHLGPDGLRLPSVQMGEEVGTRC